MYLPTHSISLKPQSNYLADTLKKINSKHSHSNYLADTFKKIFSKHLHSNF